MPGYLEGAEGPWPLRQVRWVDIAPVILKGGGRSGRPLSTVSTFDEFVSGLAETRAIWTVQDMTWTVEGILTDQPIRVVRVVNPFASRDG